MTKLSQKEFNKIVARIDKDFTWEIKEAYSASSIYFRNRQYLDTDGRAVLFTVRNARFGLWIYLSVDNKTVTHKYCNNFKEIKEIIKVASLMSEL